MTKPLAKPNCPCDAFVHPGPLRIDAGLTVLPRQRATFAGYRRAMLAELPTRAPLAAWRARGDEDLGVMLLEMWAYVCDVVSFYDETIAHESYLRTARLDPSVRRLVGLIGYRPRPAVAARVQLVLQAEGRTPVTVPAGTALRSAASADGPPQVFELDADTVVHPLVNGWDLLPTRPTAVPAKRDTLLLENRTARVEVGDHLLVQAAAGPVGDVFRAVAAARGPDGTRVTIDPALPAVVPLAGTRLLRPGSTTALWTGPLDPQSLSGAATTVVLSGVVDRIRAGERVVAVGPKGPAGLTVTAVGQDTRRVTTESTFLVDGKKVTTPPLRVPVTVLTISPGWPAARLDTDPAKVVVEYGPQEVGTLTAPEQATITPGAPLRLRPPWEAPPDGTRPRTFLLADSDGATAAVTGRLDFDTGTLVPDQGCGPTVPLRPPASAYANTAAASRGETVPSEALGTGDASAAHQSFTLRRSPLTYLSVPTTVDPNGVRSTLTVRVADIRWTEVPSFFDVPADAEVYVVRQDDAGRSTVLFGDGVHGARLPSGAPVVARYRFGAGAAVPPANGITQLVTPVPGITAVRSPAPAAGGDDAQPAHRVREIAPRSALLFGRAVSVQDMEALAAGQPGVRAVQARWAWDTERQLPTVHVWYVGPDELAGPVTTSLRSATAPSTPITAVPATPVDRALTVDLRVDRRHQRALVEAEVTARLSAPVTGLLSPERIGVGAPLHRSAVLAAVLDVEGVTGVNGLVWDGAPFAEYGYLPGEGAWFDVTLTVHGTEDTDG